MTRWKHGRIALLCAISLMMVILPSAAAQEASPVAPPEVAPSAAIGSPAPVDGAAAGQVLLNGQATSLTSAPRTSVSLDSNPPGLNAGFWNGPSCSGQMSYGIPTQNNAVTRDEPGAGSYQALDANSVPTGTCLTITWAYPATATPTPTVTPVGYGEPSVTLSCSVDGLTSATIAYAVATNRADLTDWSITAGASSVLPTAVSLDVDSPLTGSLAYSGPLPVSLPFTVHLSWTPTRPESLSGITYWPSVACAAWIPTATVTPIPSATSAATATGVPSPTPTVTQEPSSTPASTSTLTPTETATATQALGITINGSTTSPQTVIVNDMFTVALAGFTPNTTASVDFSWTECFAQQASIPVSIAQNGTGTIDLQPVVTGSLFVWGHDVQGGESACIQVEVVSPPTATSTVTLTPTSTYTATATATSTLTEVPSATATSTPTATVTQTATATETPTVTITPSSMATATSTATATVTDPPTSTPTETASQTVVPPTSTATEIPPTATGTPSPSPSPTGTAVIPESGAVIVRVETTDGSDLPESVQACVDADCRPLGALASTQPIALSLPSGSGVAFFDVPLGLHEVTLRDASGAVIDVREAVVFPDDATEVLFVLGVQPLPTATATSVPPTAAPTATSMAVSALPNTGQGGGSGSSLPLLLAIGAIALFAGGILSTRHRRWHR